MPSRFALQHLFSLIFTITKPASLLTISGATPNKLLEATAVVHLTCNPRHQSAAPQQRRSTSSEVRGSGHAVRRDFDALQRSDFPPDSHPPRFGWHDDRCGFAVQFFAQMGFVEGDFPVLCAVSFESD
jgi:hypothetical protein